MSFAVWLELSAVLCLLPVISAEELQGGKRMKICRECGREIIDGVNGCTFAGDICFDCRPVRFDLAPARKAEPTIEECDFWENKILARQEQYMD